jgi:hypothetical protein
MYKLTKYDRSSRPLSFQREEVELAVKEARARLRDSSLGLVFEPIEHKYTLHGRLMESVSEIVQSFAPFDSEKIAASCATNPRHPLFGKSVDEILSIWNEKRDKSAEAGTQIHAFSEACCLYRLGLEDKIETEYKDRITPEGLTALSPKEEASARWWDSLDLGRYAVVAKETQIANPNYGYAGTFDLLLYDTVKKGFALCDYKTNEDLFRSFGEKLSTPLNMIKADDYGKYTLQQNLYRIQLENIGIEVRDMSLVWLKNDGTFEQIPLPNYERIIRYAMETRKKN